MVCVPVAEMLNLWIATLDLAENMFLMLPVLKKADRRALCLRTGLNHAADTHDQFPSVFLESTDNASASLVLLETITLVENDPQGGLRQDRRTSPVL